MTDEAQHYNVLCIAKEKRKKNVSFLSSTNLVFFIRQVVHIFHLGVRIAIPSKVTTGSSEEPTSANFNIVSHKIYRNR